MLNESKVDSCELKPQSIMLGTNINMLVSNIAGHAVNIKDKTIIIYLFSLTTQPLIVQYTDIEKLNKDVEILRSLTNIINSQYNK